MIIEIKDNWPAETIKRLEYLRKIQEWYLARINETLWYVEDEDVLD
jgi:Na+-transporting NADH:ubiquinone oxidoreductase subunit NqrF